MNSFSFIATILFLSIHKIEIGHLMMTDKMVERNFEVGQSSRNEEGQQQSSSGIIGQKKRGWEKVIEEKTNSHNDPPIEELAAILALFDWFANYGKEIFDGTDENIFKNPGEFFKKIIGGNLDARIIEFVQNFGEFIQQNGNPPVGPKRIRPDQRGKFKKIKYPNTRTMLFEKLLLGAMNEVKIPQSEIDTSLDRGNDEVNKQRRIEQKYQFQFGFIVDCIFANYYSTELGEVNYRQILEILRTMKKKNDYDEFRRILLNNCADENTVDVFIQSIMSTNFEHDFEHLKNDVKGIFVDDIIKPYMHSMLKNNISDEDYSKLKLDPYFPEQLPKLANLGALISVFINIIKNIIEFIQPVDLDKKRKMSGILKNTIRHMTNIENLMHFIVVKHGKYYKIAMNNINNPKLRINMAKLKAEDSIFEWIFLDIEYYVDWFMKLKLNKAKYVAENYFGLNIPQNLDENTNMLNNFRQILQQIAEHIIQKYLYALRNDENEQNLNANQIEIEESNKKISLLEFLHLRIYCVGIRQKINMKEKLLVNKNSELYKKLDLDLLEIIPGTKANVEYEIMPALTKIIRDKICRLK